jgi:hypothetical protein
MVLVAGCCADFRQLSVEVPSKAYEDQRITVRIAPLKL